MIYNLHHHYPCKRHGNQLNLAAFISSIAFDDVPTSLDTSSPIAIDVISTGAEDITRNYCTTNSNHIAEEAGSHQILLQPIRSNSLACAAISEKLNDIAQVAESLDTVIGHVQDNVSGLEKSLTKSMGDEKLNTLRGISNEVIDLVYKNIPTLITLFREWRNKNEKQNPIVTKCSTLF